MLDRAEGIFANLAPILKETFDAKISQVVGRGLASRGNTLFGYRDVAVRSQSLPVHFEPCQFSPVRADSRQKRADLVKGTTGAQAFASRVPGIASHRIASHRIASHGLRLRRGWRSFERYCRSVEATAAWGGQLELRALAHVLRRRIVVYSAHLPTVEMGEEYRVEEAAPPLRVAYQCVPRYGYLAVAHRFLRTRYPFRFPQRCCAFPTPPSTASPARCAPSRTRRAWRRAWPRSASAP